MVSSPYNRGCVAVYRIDVMNIAFQLATMVDAEPIARMSQRLIETGLPWSWRPQRVRKQIRNVNSVVLVARHSIPLTGFAIMYFGDEAAHLNLLAVEPAYQRKRLGKQLVRWLESSAMVAGIFVVNLEVRACNHGARRFYRGLGYRETGLLQCYYDGAEDAVRLSHDLRIDRIQNAT